jgi:hypothetical protein
MDGGALTFKKAAVEPGENKQTDLFGGTGGKRKKSRK